MIEHVNIPDAQRHELKGASQALFGQVPISSGNGTTVFRYMDWTYIVNKPVIRGYTQSIIASSTAASQLPSATNTALKIEFGSAQSNSDVSLAADGTVTFLTAGQYLVTRMLRFGRTSLAGVAIMFVRHLINGSQSGASSSLVMDNNLDITPITSTFLIDATAGMTLSTEIIRDSSGVNVGGLYSATPVASGWGVAPSASITIQKYRGTT